MASADDIAFAQMMIPHHQQAIAMADLALAQASSPDVIVLAEQIKRAQDPEIEEMTQWLSQWGAPMTMPAEAGHDMSDMPSNGMMGAADMAALAAASGQEFDQMWLDMMIQHHDGAIAMAENVLTTSKNDAVRRLAQAVVDGQRAEITTMRQLMSS